MTTPQTLPQPLIPLASSKADLELVGGKGANLAKLARLGFPVPNGFLIPTTLYRQFIETNQIQTEIRAILDRLDFGSPSALAAASEQIRASFMRSVFPHALRDLLEIGYGWMGSPPVAVRSSATAEDLPDLSFAGQQDTYLNVVGPDALCQAVVKCWASLWTGRAIGYRARNEIDQFEVNLSVVVQEMVQSEASGVLFTANPLNGRRSETVIDATLGLGEALVSGQVEPDHYVVETSQRRLLSKTQGAKATVIRGQSSGGTEIEKKDPASSTEQAVPDVVILDLAEIGRRVEADFGAPQDIEWAWAGGKLYLLQTRPITSLYPLPESMPAEPLKVMMAFSAVQGIFEPFTPLGQDTGKLISTGLARLLNYRVSMDEQKAFYVAGERLFINFTPVLKNTIGRKILPRAIEAIDPGVAQAFKELVDDSRLAPNRKGIRPDILLRLLRFALPLARRVLLFWLNPEQRREETLRAMDALVEREEARLVPTGDMWEDFSRCLKHVETAAELFWDMYKSGGLAAVVAGMSPFFGVLQPFSRQAAKTLNEPELGILFMEVARGLPNNVTTEMDLNLWHTALSLQNDPDSMDVFSANPASELANCYLKKSLPHVAQDAIAGFMERYGMRGLGEIDLGRPRWREQPEHIMQTLQSYLKIDRAQAPDVQFARGVEAAKKAAVRLEAAAGRMRASWFRRKQVHWAIRRYRALAGMREAPKFFAIRMMGLTRQRLLESGATLAEAGLLDQAQDLFYLHFEELKQADLMRDIPEEYRQRITERRAIRQREMRRKQIPRVLLSDGTTYYEGVQSKGEQAGDMVGDPVSPGVVEGVVKVVFNPNGTQLAPGEILVCPGTDPAWTPLFLAAGGLVMEVGGMMTHGSVVAREYGIPAVVGVHQATSRLKTGQRIRVDGSMGRITILDD